MYTRFVIATGIALISTLSHAQKHHHALLEPDLDLDHFLHPSHSDSPLEFEPAPLAPPDWEKPEWLENPDQWEAPDSPEANAPPVSVEEPPLDTPQSPAPVTTEPQDRPPIPAVSPDRNDPALSAPQQPAASWATSPTQTASPAEQPAPVLPPSSLPASQVQVSPGTHTSAEPQSVKSEAATSSAAVLPVVQSQSSIYPVIVKSTDTTAEAASATSHTSIATNTNEPITFGPDGVSTSPTSAQGPRPTSVSESSPGTVDAISHVGTGTSGTSIQATTSIASDATSSSDSSTLASARSSSASMTNHPAGSSGVEPSKASSASSSTVQILTSSSTLASSATSVFGETSVTSSSTMSSATSYPGETSAYTSNIGTLTSSTTAMSYLTSSSTGSSMTTSTMLPPATNSTMETSLISSTTMPSVSNSTTTTSMIGSSLATSTTGSTGSTSQTYPTTIPSMSNSTETSPTTSLTTSMTNSTVDPSATTISTYDTSPPYAPSSSTSRTSSGDATATTTDASSSSSWASYNSTQTSTTDTETSRPTSTGQLPTATNGTLTSYPITSTSSSGSTDSTSSYDMEPTGAPTNGNSTGTTTSGYLTSSSLPPLSPTTAPNATYTSSNYTSSYTTSPVSSTQSSSHQTSIEPTTFETSTITPTIVLPTATNTESTFVPFSIIAQTSSSYTSGQASPTQPTGIPSALPKIVQNPLSSSTPQQPQDTTEVQIGFQWALNYPFVVSHPLSTTQIFTYLPIGIAEGLGLKPEQIVVKNLLPLDTTASLQFITTVGRVFIPTSMVDTLRIDLGIPVSPIYQNKDESVNTLMNYINPAIPFFPGSIMDPGTSPTKPEPSSIPSPTTGESGVFNAAAQQTQTASAKGTTAGIALAACGGAAAYGATMFLLARRYKQRKQRLRRSESFYGASEARENSNNRVAGETGAMMSGGRISPARDRDSRGSGRTGNSARAAQISGPMMAENSLGWN